MRLRILSCLVAIAWLQIALAGAAFAGGTLRVAMTAGDIPVTTGNPDQGFEGYRFVGYNLYDSLLLWDLSKSDKPSEIKPGLATSYEPDPQNHKRWIVHLRQGVTWHEGCKFSAGGLVSMIFQEPMTALDPVYTVGQQIGETVRRHTGCDGKAARARALELLELVRIPSAERRLDAYPHELSGGLRQRTMIAMALSCSPQLLLADEPTTALDATVQVQVLILLRKLQRELGMGMIFVTHDLGVAAEIADRIAVMYAGRIVEIGPVAQVLSSPLHPYTAGLLSSTVHGQDKDHDIDAIPGSPPDMRRLPQGCSFAPRCARRSIECRTTVPKLQSRPAERMAACVNL